MANGENNQPGNVIDPSVSAEVDNKTADPTLPPAEEVDFMAKQPQNTTPSASFPEFSWTASEYYDHQRGSGWYTLLTLSAVVMTGIFYLFTQSYFSAAVAPILAIIIAMAARRKPEVMKYSLDNQGLIVGRRLYSYEMFKSYQIVHDGALPSIRLIPIKRFMLPVSAYFAPDDDQKINEVLSNHLPLEEGKLEIAERLAHRLRI